MWPTFPGHRVATGHGRVGAVAEASRPKTLCSGASAYPEKRVTCWLSCLPQVRIWRNGGGVGAAACVGVLQGHAGRRGCSVCRVYTRAAQSISRNRVYADT